MVGGGGGGSIGGGCMPYLAPASPVSRLLHLARSSAEGRRRSGALEGGCQALKGGFYRSEASFYSRGATVAAAGAGLKAGQERRRSGRGGIGWHVYQVTLVCHCVSGTTPGVTKCSVLNRDTNVVFGLAGTRMTHVTWYWDLLLVTWMDGVEDTVSVWWTQGVMLAGWRLGCD